MMLPWGEPDLKSRCQPGVVATGLTGTTRSPAPRCLPQATATLCNPSSLSPRWARLGCGWTRVTEDKTFSGSKACPETDCQEHPPGRPHAAKGALSRAAQGRKERAFGVSRDVCLLSGRLGPCLLASEN